MKILVLDIETAPHKGYFWNLWKQDIALSQLIEPGYILCWAAKWEGEEMVRWRGINEATPQQMLEEVAALLDEADIVVHFFGSRFDVPWLNGQFVKHNIKPPSPYQQIDLKLIASKAFYLPSHKLEYVAQYFGVGSKMKHEGFELWKKCMDGDDGAWERMKLYNIQDVVVTEGLYHKMLPWIPYHPGRGDPNVLSCPSCGSAAVYRAGEYKARIQYYPQYRCESCGAFSRGTKAIKAKKQLTVGVKV